VSVEGDRKFLEKKAARRAMQDQILSAAITWKRETDREGIPLAELSDAEINLYRVVNRYMDQKGDT
jgi:hypothetical protein